jgi:hypothetical protein
MSGKRRALFVLPLLACVPRQDGVTRVPLGQPMELAFGDQRLLIPLDRQSAYRLQLTPAAGDYAELSASLCALDGHQRIEEGDSHCLSQEVTVDPSGASEVQIPAAADVGERRLGHLALRIYAEGTSTGPVMLVLSE